MVPARIGGVRMHQNAQGSLVEHQPRHQRRKYSVKGDLKHRLVVRADLDVMPAPERDGKAFADPASQRLRLGRVVAGIVIDMGMEACDLVVDRGTERSGSSVIPASLDSGDYVNRTDIGEALLRQRHAGRDMARFETIDVGANTVCATFSAHPTIHPSDGFPTSAPNNPLLARMMESPTFVTDIYRAPVPGCVLRPAARRAGDGRNRPAAWIDAQFAGQPELVHAAADVEVTYSNRSRYFCIRSAPMRRAIS